MPKALTRLAALPLPSCEAAATGIFDIVKRYR